MAVAASAFLLLTPPPLPPTLVLIFLPAVVIITGFLLLSRSSSGVNRSRRKGTRGLLPPGSVGLPVVGETLRLVAAYKTEDPEPFIDERVRRHGRLFTTHVFGERTVFSADAEFNRIVLGSEGKAFECSYPSSITTLLGRHSLLLMKGTLHKRMHSLTLTRFASSAVIRHSLLRDIDRLVRLTLDSWEEGRPVLLLDQMKKISFELTVKQLMSYDPGEWTESLRRHYLIVIEGFFSIPFPFSSFLSFTTYGRALNARTKVADALRGVVRKRKEEEKKRKEGEDSRLEEEAEEEEEQKMMRRKKDMLEELLEAEEGFSEEEMVDFMLALLVAGYETTSTIMTLAVKFLTETPRALSLLKEEQEEIRFRKKHEHEHDGKPLDLEWSDYKSMPFTQCVINETLRVGNIISGVFRRAVTDVDYKGFTIPKGCKVFASFRAVHLDEDHYKDARTFNPWRWMRMNGDGGGAAQFQRAAGGGGVFTPFGGGPRLCPGYELARLEISIFLHHLVTRFSWSVAEEDRLVFFPTTRMLKGYPILVQRRKDL